LEVSVSHQSLTVPVTGHGLPPLVAGVISL